MTSRKFYFCGLVHHFKMLWNFCIVRLFIYERFVQTACCLNLFFLTTRGLVPKKYYQNNNMAFFICWTSVGLVSARSYQIGVAGNGWLVTQLVVICNHLASIATFFRTRFKSDFKCSNRSISLKGTLM